MPVKFGPEGYSSPSIRRYQERQPPAFDGLRNALAHGKRTRALGVILTIAVVLAMVAYLGRSGPSSPELLATGKVEAKDTIVATDGNAKQVLGISIRLPAGGPQSVVLECSAETWGRFQPGDEVIVRYVAETGRNEISVTRIEAKPDPIKL